MMSLMTVASALAQLLQSADCSQDDQERLIEETDGFILSRDVTSSIDVPPFSNSAMDGYAVRAEDVAVGQKLPVGQVIAAGARGALHQAGSASRIFTGAPMPLGADSVLIQEDAEAVTNASTRVETAHPQQKSNYELFNRNNFNIRYWSWNYRGCWHQTCPPIDTRKGI